MFTKKGPEHHPKRKSWNMLIRVLIPSSLSQHFARDFLVKFQWALFYSFLTSRHWDEFMLEIKNVHGFQRLSFDTKSSVQSVSCSSFNASSSWWWEVVSSWNLKKWQVLNRVSLHFSNKNHEKFCLMPALEVDCICKASLQMWLQKIHRS